MTIASVILTGGHSRRMGQPKESLRLGETTFLGHVATTLLRCSQPVVVVARDATQALPPLPATVDRIFDLQTGEGPLEGLRSALRHLTINHSDCSAVYLTACDTPLADCAAVRWLADRLSTADSAVVTKTGNKPQPLCALYRPDILPTVEELRATGERSLQALLKTIPTRILDAAQVDSFDPRRQFLRNINTTEDYHALLQDREPS